MKRNFDFASSSKINLMQQWSSHQFIQSAFQKLASIKGYSQSTVVKKINQLGSKMTASSFNKILKNKEIGRSIMIDAANGLQKLLATECCLEWMNNDWQPIENCESSTVLIEENGLSNRLQLFREGRLTVAQKVAFIAAANTEIIEFGTTLNTFSNYFFSRREAEYKLPIQQLLERGVNVKCYLLDPNWNGANLYFNDREASLEQGQSGIDKIKAALEKLAIISKEFQAANHEGQFEVFTYRHFPHNYFSAVDLADTQHAKMMISNYLYGERRAYCPVMQFSRKSEPILFRRYADSLEKIMQSAKQQF